FKHSTSIDLFVLGRFFYIIAKKNNVLYRYVRQCSKARAFFAVAVTC
ncbi:MAG: hypothetical protein ACI90V_006900, partial [Bacillariaceae sp.]